jgi:RecA-family ATPase
VAQGEPFLDRTTVKGAVLYLALEEKRSEVRKHFQALGANGREPLFVHVDCAPVNALLAAKRAIEQHRPVLVIIDPLLKFARVSDANDYAQVNAALEPLLDLARKSGAHVVLVYHTGKGEKSDAVDSACGTTALGAAVDTILVLKRTERYRTLQTVQRYGMDLAETVLDFDSDRRTVLLARRNPRPTLSGLPKASWTISEASAAARRKRR